MQVVVRLLGNLNRASQGRKESITSSIAGGKLKERCRFVSTDVQYWRVSKTFFFHVRYPKLEVLSVFL